MAKREVRRGRGGESRCYCTALRKATRRLSQFYDAGLAGSGLKTTQRAILAEIGRSEPTTVGALASALVMDPGALAHTLKPLERDGYVEVKVDTHDRRSRRISLRAAGRAKLAETEALWSAAQTAFEDSFGTAKAIALRQALETLISDDVTAALDAHAAASSPRHGWPPSRPSRAKRST